MSVSQPTVTQKNKLKLIQQETTSSPPKKWVKDEKNV
jgi:hypothetical protein